MATYDLTSNIPAASSLAAGDILNCPYSGTYKTIELPKGTYTLQCWGAQGGSYSSTYYGGKGGYAIGTITLDKKSTVYLYAGGQGTSVTSSTTGGAGGFNGGGKGGNGSNSSYGRAGSGGGGASDIRVDDSALSNRVIVAGGGGGASGPGCGGGLSLSANTASIGGAAGVAGASSTATSYCGKGGGAGTTSGGGAGGAVTTASTSSADNTYYAGGGGGGGAGYYGGGGGGGGSLSSSSCRGKAGSAGSLGTGGAGGASYSSSAYAYYGSGGGSGGGGSSWVSSNLTSISTSNGNASFVGTSGSNETGHTGNGYVRITIVEVIQTDEDGVKNLYIKTGTNGSLPSDYIELPYIESSGTSYIDTNLSAPNGFYVEAEFSVLSLAHTETSAIIGSHEAASPYYRNYIGVEGTGAFNLGHYNYTLGENGKVKIGEKYTISACTIQNNLFLNSNNEYLLKGTDENATRSSKTLYIFNINGYSAPIMPMRLYSMKIYTDAQKTQIARNYIPALRISDNKAGLYDLVNSTFYVDAAGGNFIYSINSYIDNNTIYYIKGNSPTENAGTTGTITNTGVIATPNDMLYFDGNGQLSLSNNIITGTNDWSIDWWEYRLDSTDSRAVYHSNYGSRTGYGMLIGYSSGGKVNAYATSANSTWNIFSGLAMGTVKVKEWVHRAMSRKGSSFYTFENGKLIATATSSASIAGNLTPTIGYYDYSTVPKFYGYLKHIRISNVARWTSDFIPPNKNMDYGTGYSKIAESYIKVPNKQTASFSNDYYPLKYIESNGTQWINTGFTPNQSSAISIDVQCFGAHSTHAALCSARPSNSTSTNTIMIFLLNGTAWNADRGSTATNRKVFSTVSLTNRITVDLNKHHISFNKGEVSQNFSSTETFVCGGPLSLLYDYSHSQYPMRARLYGCKIWDNDTLIRDLVPALRISDSMAGLYDKINSIFYTDAAGGNFLYNPIEMDNNITFYLSGKTLSNEGSGSGSIVTNNGVVSVNNLLYFNGNSNLIINDTTSLNSQNFTVDWWEYPLSTPAYGTLFDVPAAGKTAYCARLGYTTSSGTADSVGFYFSSDGTSWNVAAYTKMGERTVNQWKHRAFVRKGANFYIFENGILTNTITNSALLAAAGNPYIGSRATGSGFFHGFLKNFRISKESYWSNNFTPPTFSHGEEWRSIESIYIKNTIPSGYTRLEYLESTGTQYTDTGLIPNSNTKTVIDCILPTTSSESWYICGAREESYVDNYALQTTSGLYYSKHGPKESEGSLSIPSVTHRMKFIKDSNVFIVDGNIGYCLPADFTCKRSMYLFACNSAGTVYGPTPCKIYRVQIYQDGTTLSRDMVPILRNSDKKTGFYDLVTGTFYPNLDTTAEFNYVISNGWEKIS